MTELRTPEQYFSHCGWSGTPGTILDVLSVRARQDPGKTQFFFLDELSAAPRSMTLDELCRQTEAVAGFLVNQLPSAGGGEREEVVILLLPPDHPFIVAMLGVQRAGFIPAAIYPPSSPLRLAEQVERAAGIVIDAGASAILTDRLLMPFAKLLGAKVPGLRVLQLAEAWMAQPSRLPPPPTPDRVAFLQYSSGSTGSPKGVAITHRNLMAQLWLLGQAIPALRDPVRAAQQRVVSWLPPYHDMGLIGCLFYPIYWGIQSYLASPLTFIRKPWLWLRWISEFRATQTVAPNFAYHRCAHRLRDQDLAGLDLSSLEIAWNGAEPIRPEAVRRFSERFSPYGFTSTAMYPVYGLAEYTLCVTHPEVGEGVRFDAIDRRRWEEEGLAVPAAPNDPDRVEIAGVGHPGCETEVCIRDASGQELPERQRGEICLRGSSLMRGYHRRAPEPADWHPGGWFRTGDLGYLAQGRLHIAGRLKELIIVGGRNIFPHDLEEAACQVDGVRQGKIVAFGIDDPERGTEAVILCLEQERPVPGADAIRLRREIRQAVEAGVGIVPSRVELVVAGWIEKTSSGKLRRGSCRTRYLQEMAGKRGAEVASEP